MKYKLGDTLECRITGMTGKVTQASKHIYSQNRYNIQPLYDNQERKMPSAYFMDEASLFKIEDSDLEQIPEYKNGHIQLGDIVQDTLLDMSGKVIERSLCINGCYRLKISYKDNKNGHPHTFWAEEKGVEVLKPISETNTKPEDRTTGSAMEENPW